MNQGAVLKQEDRQADESVDVVPFFPLDRPHRLEIEAAIRRFTHIEDLCTVTGDCLTECAKAGWCYVEIPATRKSATMALRSII